MSSSSERARAERVIKGAGQTVPLSPVRAAPPAPPAPPMAAQTVHTSLDELIEQARREAFEQGRAAGAAEVRASAQAARTAAVRRTAAQLEQAARQVARLRSDVVDEVVGDLAGLVTDVAEVLIGRELVLGATAVREAIVRALALAPRGPDLVVHVHPDCELDDDEIVEVTAGAQVTAGARVTVVRDPEVDVHGCRITAGGCDIDAQIPAALARVRSTLDGLLPTLAAATRQELEAQLPANLDPDPAEDDETFGAPTGRLDADAPGVAQSDPVCEGVA